MKKWLKFLIPAIILLCVVILALIYTRPRTIEQRYPVLELSQCVQISGYYSDSAGAEPIPFAINRGSPHFEEVVKLFQSPSFKTKLRNLFPSGTKTHLYHEGDFQWSVIFQFEEVHFPTGDTGSGDMLRIENFYGDLELHFDGRTMQCSIKDQNEWLSAVMDIISLSPAQK